MFNVKNKENETTQWVETDTSWMSLLLIYKWSNHIARNTNFFKNKNQTNFYDFLVRIFVKCELAANDQGQSNTIPFVSFSTTAKNSVPNLFNNTQEMCHFKAYCHKRLLWNALFISCRMLSWKIGPGRVTKWIAHQWI